MTDALDAGIAPVTLHTLQWGRVGAPRVLLVHGVQSAGNTWWQVADGLADAGLHVTAPDLRGHGRSPTARCYRFAELVTDLVTVGRDWDLVVGHSLGGTLVAQSVVDIPGFTRHAVLLDPVFELPDEQFEVIVADQLAELAWDVVTIARANPRWHREDARQKVLAAAACSPYAAEAVLRDNRPWDHSGVLADVTTPVTILGADPAAGAMLDPTTGERLAGANENVSYRMIPGIGHSVHRDAPATVLWALLDVLDRTGRG